MCPTLILALLLGVPDDEAAARALYAGEPGYAEAWPVEFHIRVVEPLLQRLARDFRGHPEPVRGDHFTDRVWIGLFGRSVQSPMVGKVTRMHGLPEPPGRSSLPGLQAKLAAYLEDFEYVERASLKVKTGTVARPGLFEAVVQMQVAGRERTGFSGKAQMRHDQAMVDVTFEKVGGRWRIARFVVKSSITDRAPERIFRDVTDTWLSSLPSATRGRLVRLSASDHIHAQLLAKKKVSPRLQPVAMDLHPGVVVVDLDQDGWDDLFVWDVLGPATFLRNEGDRFADQTTKFGLDVQNVSGALFADFDGDGVIDLLLGSWFSASRLLWGQTDPDGRWRPEPSALKLPAEVVTLSTADVDGDGDLDLFLGTAAHDHHARHAPDRDANVDQVGPPNLLLLNQGDRRFRDGTEEMGLTLRRNTLQASFADHDDDGDVDLFLGNDFAPASLFENRDGRFVDVSIASGVDRILFGMGATWGDVDRDGDLDLYTSAMASSAGVRVMDGDRFASDLDALDRRRRRDAARGNTLLINGGAGRFEAQIQRAGWSYGAQLIDLDGNGWLDVYAPNGFFTAPGSGDGVFRDL